MKKIDIKGLCLGLGFALSVGTTLYVGLSANSNKETLASSYPVNSVPKNINLNDTSASDIREYYASLNSLSASERQGTNLLKNLKPILKNGQKYFSYAGQDCIFD